MLLGHEDNSCSSKQLLIDAAGSGRQQLLFQTAANVLAAAATGLKSVCAGTFPPSCSGPFAPIVRGAPVKKNNIVMIHNF